MNPPSEGNAVGDNSVIGETVERDVKPPLPIIRETAGLGRLV
jgi:hypothetical protein